MQTTKTQARSKTNWRPAARAVTLAAGLLLLGSLGSLGLPGVAEAQRSGFAFLRVPVSARSAALGGAGTSFLEGARAAPTNPAGIADPHGRATSTAPWRIDAEATLTHHEALADLRQDAVSAKIAKGPDAFAATFNSMYSQGIDLRDEIGDLQGTFGLTDLQAGLGYARYLPGGVRLGGSASFVQEDIAGSTASTWYANLGVRYDPESLPGLQVGAAALYLGPNAQFTVDGNPGEKFSLPTTFQGGLAFGTPIGGEASWMVTGEARKAKDEDVTGHAGLELKYSIVALRGGGRFNTAEGDFTAGLGVIAGRFSFDYAYIAFGDALGDTHRAELGINFGL